MENDNEELGYMKLELIDKLMNLYLVGTGKKANHKNDKGEYEIVSFIIKSIKLLKIKGDSPIYNIEDKFILDFFSCLFKHGIINE